MVAIASFSLSARQWQHETPVPFKTAIDVDDLTTARQIYEEESLRGTQLQAID